MEVHHHSHTADPGSHRGRKKWTHYFWEFLMLFLAVTLGFFIENQREHYVEHVRAKEFAALMYEDLDTIYTSNPEIFDWNKKTAIKLFNTMALLREQNDLLDRSYNSASEKAVILMELLHKK